MSVTEKTAASTALRTFQFAVRGEPAPQGSKSYKGHSKEGHAILVESSKKVAPWRGDIVRAALEEIDKTPGFKPIQGPVHLIIEFYETRPKSAPKTRRTIPSTVPDLSKLVRSTEDAMKTAGVWRDDAQVVDLTTRKRYGTLGDETIGLPWELPTHGAVITVVELDPEQTWSDLPLDIAADGRFASPTLPAPLTTCPTPQRFVIEEWGTAVVITATMTDAKVRAALAKISKESDLRVADSRNGDGPLDAIAVAVEGGSRRFASVKGKPLTDLQQTLMDIVGAAEEFGTEIVVIFPEEIA